MKTAAAVWSGTRTLRRKSTLREMASPALGLAGRRRWVLAAAPRVLEVPCGAAETAARAHQIAMGSLSFPSLPVSLGHVTVSGHLSMSKSDICRFGGWFRVDVSPPSFLLLGVPTVKL